MTTVEIRTVTVEVQAGAWSLPAYQAAPIEGGPFPAIIVLQEVFGVNAHIRDITERLARLGYVAIAPALYERLAPGFEVGYTEEDLKLGRHYKDQTQSSELLGDIQATIDYLNTQPNVKPGAIGCIGFCFGGHVAYLAATLPDITVTASFYGAGIPTMTPGGGAPTLSRTPDIHGTIHLFFGLDDVSIPDTHLQQIESELQRHGVDYKVWRYAAAGHGFFCDQRASYSAEAAADAWIRVQQLFREKLR